MRTISVEYRLGLAAVCFVAFGALGAYVSGRPPARLDVAATALRGEATALAAFFTALGRWYAITAIAAAGAAFALATRTSVWPLGILIASQVASQGVVSVLKSLFGRPRPGHWLLYREPDLSYPSGHCVTTVVFYGSLLLLLLRTPLVPRPAALVLACGSAVCLVGIPWSRLALGAHYATDVAGGLLFGAGWLCLTSALLSRFAP